MALKNFEELIHAVRKGDKKKIAAVVCAHDAHTLQAVLRAQGDGILFPILIGDAAKIRRILQSLNADDNASEIIDAKTDGEAARTGVGLIREGRADFLMKGMLQTADLLKAVVDRENGLRTESLMSHFVITEIPGYHKLLAMTDGGMVMYPDLAQKKQILQNALAVLRRLGYERPKVAVLAAVETVNPKMPETLDAAALKKMNETGEIPDCVIEGPISYDLAVSRASAEAKGYLSPVAGDADILLLPNITAGNILGKALLFSGGAKMAGIVVGARAPIVLTSRGATAEEKYLSLAIAAAI